MKILILGSSGFLGQILTKDLKKIKNFKIFHNGINFKKVDLTNIAYLEKIILKSDPDILINCCGLTNLNICEINKKLSKKLNYEIIKNIFHIKKKRKLFYKVIHFSSDQLYDAKNKSGNTEKNKIFLNNQYSKDKYKADKLASKNGSLILRINFFGYSATKKGFLNWVYDSFLQKKKFYLFNDVFFNPIGISTLSKIIRRLIFIISIKKKTAGIYNIGAKDGIYKNDLAIYFAKKTHIFNNNFESLGVNEINNSVKKSKNMFMNVSKFEKKFNIKLPSIKKEISHESKNFLKYAYKNR